MKQYAVTIMIFINTLVLKAQHEHNMHHHEDIQGESGMSHSLSQNLPMSVNGSGTSWLPDSSPVYGNMFHRGNWMIMAHYNLFLRYNTQDIFGEGKGKGSQIDAPNWLMGMAQRKIKSKGLLTTRLMITAEPFTIGGNGYPLIFQTGETWKGKPLIDRQHPHDLIGEFSVSYAYELSKKSDLYAYLAYPGEPASGPVTFMHRPSAMTNPDAPLGHHWQDATHISYGVATLGWRFNSVKLEASTFNGKEPDENRYKLDPAKFNSYSYRVLFNPRQRITLHYGQAFLKEPEITHPEEDIIRSSASIIYHHPLRDKNVWLSSLVWGMNTEAGTTSHEHSVLYESTLILEKNSWYGKYEWVQKSGEELVIQNSDHQLFNIQSATIGFTRNIISSTKLNVLLGGQCSIYIPDPSLHDLYGKTPVGAELFLRISPPRIL